MADMQILSILLIACLWNGCDGARIQCKSETAPVTSDLPAKIELPPIYTASIRYSYWNNRTNTLIEEQKLSETLRIKRTSQAINDAFIISNTNTTINFNETWCSTVSETSHLDGIYGMPEEVRNQLKFNGYSIESLIKSILVGNFTQKFYSNDTVAVDGIEAVLWIGCMPKIDQGSTSMQVEVAFAGENSSAPYSARIHNPVALSVNILLYNESDPRNITNHVSFDIVQLDVPKSEQDLVSLIEVPRGVYCEGMKSSEIQAKLPDKFEAAFDYTDVFGKFVNDIHMFYDGAQRIISFGMNVVADRDAPFIGNVSLPKDFTMVNIIHDFKYGLQYIIDAENSECKEVKGIDAGFGDVITMPLNDSTTKQLDMKSPQQILMNISNSQFYLHGRRLLEDGIEVDVYVSRSTTQTPQQTYTVVELLFAAKPWRLDALQTPFLHSIVQYHKNESGHELGRTIIRLHAFRNGTEQTSRWTSISAYPCLKLIEDSYLFVNIKNSSLASLEKLGLTDVENTLREAIANASGVSVLRVANFFFKQIQDNVVVFFVIGEASGVAPAETRDRLNETSAIEAQHQLNSTLMERDISFMVPAGSGHPKTELKLARTSLGVIPSKWSPSPGPPGPAPFNGYTGGSMFVLAVFMLMLGVAIGVGGMFFIWKRQRLSGLAYQVFE